MFKSILYTSNPNFVPTTFNDVENFAEEESKYLTCMVSEDSKLYNVKPGAHILTTKGNHVYILETGDDYNWAKKSNITGIASIDYPFNTENKTMTTNSISNFSDRLKNMFMPTEVNDVRIATDGNICVATSQGYVAIDAQNHLTSYPEELTLALPVFVMCKPKEALVVGDVIALEKSYAKITSIKGEKINAISYTGAGKIIRTIKDFLFNQTMVRVVVSLAGNVGGQMNPMMLLALSKDNKMSSLLPFMMMGQNGGALSANPMMLALLAGGDSDFSTKDMLMMSVMGGNNIFGNMFAAPAVPTAVPTVAPTAEAETEEDID